MLYKHVMKIVDEAIALKESGKLNEDLKDAVLKAIQFAMMEIYTGESMDLPKGISEVQALAILQEKTYDLGEVVDNFGPDDLSVMQRSREEVQAAFDMMPEDKDIEDLQTLSKMLYRAWRRSEAQTYAESLWAFRDNDPKDWSR